MERFIPLAGDPEQVLGEPYETEKLSRKDDLKRHWSWDGVPWVCSSLDQPDQRKRNLSWSTTAHPEAQNLIVSLDDQDGTVVRMVLLYRRAAGAGLVQVNYYRNGMTTLYDYSKKTPGDELLNPSLIKEFEKAIPAGLLA